MTNTRQSILLIDNDREYCKATRKMLERAGYRVTVAADGLEALDVLSQKVFDLLIFGLRMPNIGGVELMEEIQKREISTPVIFVTGFGEVQSYMDVMNMGAFDYVNKPLEGPTFLRLIRSAISACGASLHSVCV